MCRYTLYACTQAPRSILCEYLLCSWLDSYALRFTRGQHANASIPDLATKFLPTTYPPAGSLIPQRRAATCDILSYVARFGICTPELLGAVEKYILHTTMCGNIYQLHGLFPVGKPCLYPLHLACHTVPERILRAITTVDTEQELATVPEYLQAPLRTMVDTMNAMVPSAHREASMPRPPLAHLELLLRLVLLHRASPNSLQGYPLAMAVHRMSMPIICFLLAVGADPGLKQGFALQLASKKGWLEGLRMLVERDDKLEAQWKQQVHSLSETMHTIVALRMHRPRPPPRKNAEPGGTKRRRIEDRLKLDTTHLQTAVRSNAWNVVAYMMQQKGVVPDVDTLRLMEVHGIT